jgi:hypothetical protein
MALVINDRVKETSTTTGTGTFDLAGASQDFISFVSGVGNTNTTYYCIANTGTDEFEVGIGTVTDAATDTLSRDTVISNNLGTTAKIDFGCRRERSILYYPCKESNVSSNGSNRICSNSCINFR